MKRLYTSISVLALLVAASLAAQQSANSGLGMGIGSISHLTHAKTRSISAENPTGEKGKGGMATEGIGAGAARELGQGWKISPAVRINPKQSFPPSAKSRVPEVIQHIWMTPTGQWRYSILRIYWDGEPEPSVEVPVGDFFASGWQKYGQVSSLAVCSNPHSGLNSYWPMPFHKSARITIENLDTEAITLYYQVDYSLTDVPADEGYFHAQFRRANPQPYKEPYTILDGVRGWGQYVGTYLAWGTHTSKWWGEGEVKFYIDGDTKFPTICGTGTEDYFGGSYDFENDDHKYQEFTTPYSSLSLVISPDGLYQSQQRFSLYRWHIMDPVHFDKDLKVTIHALGWRSGGRYLPLQDDIASTAFWYQTEPHAPFPPLPDKDALELK